MKKEEYTDEQKKNMEEFLNFIFSFDEDESEAIDHHRPMTQDLFDRCIDKCIELKCDNLFFELLSKYPELNDVYASRIEAETEGLSKNISEQTEKIGNNI